MSVRPAAPEGHEESETRQADTDVEALLVLADQVRRVRADQREALTWLAEHGVPGHPS